MDNNRVMSPRDIPAHPPERLELDGPAGKLAATLEVPLNVKLRGVVLLLHPHPEHGGTRKNNVVRYGALGALAAGCAALRIDFRGAGDSQGEYDNGVGEIDDAASAFAWLRGRFPRLPIIVWGFSFGSRVGLEFCSQLISQSSKNAPPAAGYLAIAWPSNFYSWPEIEHWPSQMAFIAGDQDDFVDFTKMNPVGEHNASLKIVKGADHFFNGMLSEVQNFTSHKIEEWLN